MDANRLKLLKRLGVKYVVPARPRAVEPVTIATIDEVSPALERNRSVESSTAVSAPPPVGSDSKVDTLVELERSICDCQRCALGKTRKNIVFGSGPPAAEVVFVGEAPGADEDEQGKPFVGRAGQLLTKIIESTKVWKREDVYICNVLKCRLPADRSTHPEEIEACRPHLEAQLKTLQPRLIMALGASAAQTLLKTEEGVSQLRGRWHDLDGVPVRVTYHPEELLRAERLKREVWEDMKAFTAKYRAIKTP